MRKALTAAAALVLVAVVAIGLATAGGNEGEDTDTDAGPPLSEQLGALEGAPAPLAALHRQAGRLLDGGAEAFEARIAELDGYPVVVNKWASWCGPCRVEFPHFRNQALKRGHEVAFIGVNSADNDDDARRFLEQLPVPFPSYRDPESEVAEVFKGVVAFPTTAFYDSDGELVHTKQGQYRTEADLAEDIERYAK